jgi:hypothetical protein
MQGDAQMNRLQATISRKLVEQFKVTTEDADEAHVVSNLFAAKVTRSFLRQALRPAMALATLQGSVFERTAGRMGTCHLTGRHASYRIRFDGRSDDLATVDVAILPRNNTDPVQTLASGTVVLDPSHTRHVSASHVVDRWDCLLDVSERLRPLVDRTADLPPIDDFDWLLIADGGLPGAATRTVVDAMRRRHASLLMVDTHASLSRIGSLPAHQEIDLGEGITLKGSMLQGRSSVTFTAPEPSHCATLAIAREGWSIVSRVENGVSILLPSIGTLCFDCEKADFTDFKAMEEALGFPVATLGAIIEQVHEAGERLSAAPAVPTPSFR